MNVDEYLKDRVDDQIAWYDTKSATNQAWFKRVQVIIIVASAAIPFVSGFADASTLFFKVSVGALGLIIAALTAVLGVYRFQELWVTYRSTCESLRQERYLFLTKTPPYDEANAFSRLVERVEAVIASENTGWSERTISDPSARNQAIPAKATSSSDYRG